MRLAALALVLVTPATVHADAIGVPDCPVGGYGVPNPHHGMGHCAAAPCETDADCAAPTGLGGMGGFGMGGRPRGTRCRVVGVCTWGDRGDAVAACTDDGAACGGRVYSDGGVCRVRGHCVGEAEAESLPLPSGTTASGPPAVAAPVEPPAVPSAPVVAPPIAAVPSAAPTGSCGCTASTSPAPLSALSALLGLAVRRRRGQPWRARR